MKQCLRYLQGTTAYGLIFQLSDTSLLRLVGYSSHNVDPDDAKAQPDMCFISARFQKHGLEPKIYTKYLIVIRI